MIDIKKKAMRRSAKLDNIFCISFLALFLLQWIVFWVYANFNSAAIAFMHYDRVKGEHVFFDAAHLFDNFKLVFTTIAGTSGKFVANGVIMHLISTVVCLPASYMIAYIIYKKLPASGFFQVVLYLPVILSPLVTTLLFKHIIESGLYGFWERYFGKPLPHLFSDPRYNWWIVAVYIIFFGLPGSFLINLGSMARVPKELIEYGELQPQPLLGLTISRIPEVLDGELTGLRVEEVSPGLGGEAAGVEVGDYILSFNGQEITRIEQILSIRQTLSVGDMVEIQVWRDGEILTLTMEMMAGE